MPGDSVQDPDLAEAVFGLAQRLMALEAPILDAAGVSMWEYAILTVLSRDGALSQVELSRRTGRDTTRLGKHLSELQSRGLISREQQSSDARRRTATLTSAGQTAQIELRTAIRSAEDQLLSRLLPGNDAETLRRTLTSIFRADKIVP